MRPLKLTVVALLTTYALLATWMVAQGGLTDPVGGDFRSFLASARIACAFGYAEVYNLEVQREAQERLVARYKTGKIDVLPTFFLPVFVVPFQAFLPFCFPIGFGLWTLLNVGALAWWAYRFAGSKDFLWVLGLLLASFPAFANFLWGQVNVWLLICVAGFLKAWERKHLFHSGIWLGGLMLKPQTLIWVIPALMLLREWRILAGFSATALALLLFSLVLAGPDGMISWLCLPLRYTGVSSAIVPEAMTNIRALGHVLALALSPKWAWGIASAIGFFTGALSLWTTLVARRRGVRSKSSLLLSWLAATSLVAWHSNGHMAMFLFSPLLHLALTEGQAMRSLISWVLLPSLVFVVAGLFAMPLLTALTTFAPPLPSVAYPALTLLGFNVYFVVREALETWKFVRRKT